MFSLDKEGVKKVFAQLAALTAVFSAASFLLELAPPADVLPRSRSEAAYAVLRRTGTETEPAGVVAEAVLVRRVVTGDTLFTRNETEPFAVASLVKLMTALIFAERVSPLELVSISKDAKSFLEPDEKRSFVEAGARIKAEDLLKLIVAESDNDAAYAAAETISLRQKPVLENTAFAERLAAFVAIMNQRGAEMGLQKTFFVNPSGRDNMLGFSTADDLFRIGAEIYAKTRDVWSASRLAEGEIYSLEGRAYRFVNTNKLLSEFPAIYGSKTGFTDEAGEAIFMLYELAPRDPIAVIVLRSKDRFGDSRKIINWLENSFGYE